MNPDRVSERVIVTPTIERGGDRLRPFLTDTSTLTTGESELQRAQGRRIEELEQAIRDRDVLVGLISHELRTPLTTIFGSAHLLLKRLEYLDVDSRTLIINNIREEAERLNGLVDNMLLLARSEAGEPIPTEPIALTRLLGEAAFEHQKRFGDRSVIVRVKPRGLIAEGQPEYLQQVLQNLVSNAEKYSPGVEPISLQARLGHEGVVISVLDRGPGVASAESEIIFQPFYRSARTSPGVGGAGIGLAVCKLLVQAQSGRIWTQPRRGGGSVFAFTLPVAVEEMTSDISR